MVVAIVAAIVIVVSGITASPATGAVGGTSSKSRVVHVDQGNLRGVQANGIRSFRGIPFAAPPVGELRFAAPSEPARWRGVRDATTASPACLQGGMGDVSSGQITSEDCLYLDIYSPERAAPGHRLPVIVWIHGGGFGGGSGGEFDGSELARLTQSVVVSVNYRLGALGFLAVEEMGEAVGNFGILDQAAALTWVNRNISAFGGDPGSVTLDGQSAGAMSICSLLVSPLTEGLFDKAILQSGPCTFPASSAASTAVVRGDTAAASLGCPSAADRMDCLRGLESGALMRVSGRFAPVHGVPAVPTSPLEAIAAGDWHKVPLLVGSTRYEGKQGIYFSAGPDAGSMTVEQYEAKVRQFHGPRADAILHRYPASDFEKPAYALAAIDTDSGFGCRSYEFAELAAAQVPVYEYEFDDPTSPTNKGMSIAGLDMASAHSADLAYLFAYSDVERPLTQSERELATRMKLYWGEFAETGALGSPWEPVTALDHPVLRLQSGEDEVFRTFADDHNCAFWATQR
ncbi:MAG: carboxylesterase family protein [Microbacterium sp.]